MGNHSIRRVGRHLPAIVALLVAFGATSAAASGGELSPATAATDVVAGSYAGTLFDAPVAVALTAKAPETEGEPRTVSMYLCNGTSIAVWLTGETTGNSATLRSADGRFGAQVAVSTRRAGGVVRFPGSETHKFVIANVVRVAGLFDVKVAQNGLVEGRSSTGATLAGRVGITGALPANGSLAATASAGGVAVKLTALGRDLTPGTYRWIVLADGTVFGANKRGPGSGRIGGIGPSLVGGLKVVKIQAGGAGIKGWDTARCQRLANQWSKLVDSAADDILKGKDASADAKLSKAEGILSTLESKCMVTGIG